MAEINSNTQPENSSSNQPAAAAPVDPSKLLAFSIPEVAGATAYFVRDKDGKVLARTEDELNAAQSEAAAGQ